MPHDATSFLALTWPIKLEYMRGWTALLLWAGLAAPVIFLGLRSLAGLGPVRKWVAMGARLAVLAALVLIIAGIRWQRQSRELEVIVLRDNSESVLHYHGYPGNDIESSLYHYLTAATERKYKPPDDRIGIVSFNDNALIDAIPNKTLVFDAKPITSYGNGTDISSAVQLALATFSPGTMRRMVLISDGNANMGDTDAAIDAAAAQNE